ncbi:MAG: hypothetical protein R3314_12715, partial [Longimicrobiales bacterium]|nr:hypothetical protein [Longimicrobiales bacterium]
MGDPRSLWHELKRRRVWRTAAVYAAVSWGVLQLADVVWEPLGLPPWTMTFVIVLAIIGFPLVLTLEWVFETSAEGVKRTSRTGEAREGGSVMLWPVAAGGVLLLLVALGAWQLTTGDGSDGRAGVPPSTPGDSSAVTSETEVGDGRALTRLAVLPFTNIRGDPELDYLGFALADQVIGAISYVRDVLVRPSSAIRPYRDRTVDAETAGRQLGVDYVLTGNFL